MEHVLQMPPALVPRGAVGSIAGLVAFVKRAIRNLVLTDEERNLLNLAVYIGVKLGAPLLSAQSRDDLDERIDRVIEGTDLVELSEFGLRVLTDETFQQVMKQERHVPPEVWSAFGKGATLELEEGDRLALETFRAIWQLKALLPATVELVRGTRGALDPLGFLADPYVPVPVAEALLGGFQAAACQAAIMQALITEQRPEPWLALALAEGWVRSQRAYLRLLASIPGISVAEEIIPAEERLDLAAIEAQALRAEERFRERLDEAKASGESIFPPEGDSSDESL
jgi:hypothetical protein